MPRMSRRKSAKYNRKRRYNKRKYNNKLRRQVHYFKRIVNLGTYTASTSGGSIPTEVPIAKSFSFQLNDLPNTSEYVSLFDQYKITGIKIKVIPKVSVVSQGAWVNNTATVGYGQVVSVIDYDDADTPTSKDELLEYGSAKVTSVTKIHQRYIKPKVLNEVYINSLSTGYAPAKSRWLDTDYSTVQHYGLKLWVDVPEPAPGSTTGPSSISYDVYGTYYFKCMNTK